MTKPIPISRKTKSQPHTLDQTTQHTCPICGAMTEQRQMGQKTGWICLVGGYSHYYQARYGHLERWFTSGEGNLREPVIQAMNCAA